MFSFLHYDTIYLLYNFSFFKAKNAEENELLSTTVIKENSFRKRNQINQPLVDTYELKRKKKARKGCNKTLGVEYNIIFKIYGTTQPRRHSMTILGHQVDR